MSSSEKSLIVAPPGDLVPGGDVLEAMVSVAERVAKSGLAGTTDAASVLTIALTGRELGIPFMTAVRGIHVIEKKPSLSAEMMQALIIRDHGDNAVRIVESTNERCVIRYRKRGWPEGDEQQSEFTIEDAQRAELTGKANWKRYPKAMLRSRCIAQVAHEAFATSLLGIYTAEELGSADATETWSMEAEPETPAVAAMRELVEAPADAVDEERSDGDRSLDPDADADMDASFQWHRTALTDAGTSRALYDAWAEASAGGWSSDDELKAIFNERKRALGAKAAVGGGR